MNKQKGFTLIEVIVSLLIVAILGSIAAFGMTRMAQNYVFSQANAQVSQKSQLAIVRITKELTELVTIPSNSTSTSLFITENNAISRSVGYDSGTSTIRINDTGGAITSGDILVDKVSSFSFTYWYGNPAQSTSTWTVGTNNISQLAFIDVNFTLNRSDGGTYTVSTRVGPRNSGGAGGTAPTSSAPVAPNYGCFIATACYGSADHPAVIILREFRDRFLMPWKGGQMLTQIYYKYSPQLADRIRENEILMTISRIMLFPVVISAMLLLNCPLIFAFFAIFSLFICGRFAWKKRLRKNKVFIGNSQGLILITAIITILIMSVLGAAMLTLWSSSEFSQVISDQGQKSYYLAEAGFRYASSLYFNAGSDASRIAAMTNMNNTSYTLLNNDGAFSIKVYPYWFRSSSSTASTLATTLPGQFDPSASLPSTGYLQINGNYYTYTGNSGATAGSTSVTFSGVTPSVAAVSANTDVLNVVLPASNQTLTAANGNITLASTGTSFLPLTNGNFSLDPPAAGTTAGTQYTYSYRIGNTLYGVNLSDTTQTWTTVTLTAGAINSNGTTSGTKIVASRFLRLSCTGTYGVASRNVVYNVPIGWVYGGQGYHVQQYYDPFNNLTNWSAVTGGELML